MTKLSCLEVSLTLLRRGGYGKLVQKELETQRQLVDYGAGSLGPFQPAVPIPCKLSIIAFSPYAVLTCACHLLLYFKSLAVHNLNCLRRHDC